MPAIVAVPPRAKGHFCQGGPEGHAFGIEPVGLQLATTGKSSVMPFFSTAFLVLEVLYTSKRSALPKYRFRHTWRVAEHLLKGVVQLYGIAVRLVKKKTASSRCIGRRASRMMPT